MTWVLDTGDTYVSARILHRSEPISIARGATPCSFRCYLETRGSEERFERMFLGNQDEKTSIEREDEDKQTGNNIICSAS